MGQFEAQLAILEHKNIICAGYSAVMHAHTLAEEVSLVALLHYFDKATGRKSKKPPQFAKRGQKIVALIEADQAICIERFVGVPFDSLAMHDAVKHDIWEVNHHLRDEHCE